MLIFFLLFSLFRIVDGALEITDYEQCHAEGDEVVFSEIFERWDKRFFAFTLKMIKSEYLAEEITQEILSGFDL